MIKTFPPFSFIKLVRYACNSDRRSTPINGRRPWVLKTIWKMWFEYVCAIRNLKPANFESIFIACIARYRKWARNSGRRPRHFCSPYRKIWVNCATSRVVEDHGINALCDVSSCRRLRRLEYLSDLPTSGDVGYTYYVGIRRLRHLRNLSR